MQRTGCCRETRLVLHVYLAHHELESIYIVVVVVDVAICVQSAGWCCVFLTSTSQLACQARDQIKTKTTSQAQACRHRHQDEHGLCLP